MELRSLWRICAAKYTSASLDGEGARLTGGRWNERGTRVIYASESLSLATLEVLVHAPPGQLAAANLVVVELAVPDRAGTKSVREPELPLNWRKYPGPARLQALGTGWAVGRASLLLRVPSAVIPSEWNVLINPAHPDIALVTIKSIRKFDPDPRLRK